MTKLYRLSVAVYGDKIDGAVNKHLANNTIKFKDFLACLGVTSATYYTRIRRGVMKTRHIKRMEELWIDTNLFIK